MASILVFAVLNFLKKWKMSKLVQKCLSSKPMIKYCMQGFEKSIFSHFASLFCKQHTKLSFLIQYHLWNSPNYLDKSVIFIFSEDINSKVFLKDEA